MIKDWSSEYVLPPHEGPDFFFHLVPFEVYDSSTDRSGYYDPRGLQHFGGGAPFLFIPHQVYIKLNRTCLFFKKLEIGDFWLLTIFRKRLDGMKITQYEENDLVYHHLWGGLAREAYRLDKAWKCSEHLLHING